MRSDDDERNADFEQLRAAAKQALQKQQAADAKAELKNFDDIFQELQVHQVELEMQNDELRVVNEDLEFQRLKFAKLYDLAPVGYIILNHAGIIEEINTAGRQLLGFNDKLITHKRLSSFIEPNSADKFYAFFRKLIDSNTRSNIQLEIVSGAVRRFHAQIEGVAVKFSSQCFITLIDIDETVVSRQKLADSNNRLEMALQAATAGTWTLKLDSMVFNFDTHSYGVCNIDKNKFDNRYQSFLDLIHPDDRFTADQSFRTAIQNGQELDLITRIVNKNGAPCYVSIRGHRPDAHSPGNMIGIMWDVTEKKRTEEAAEQLRLEHQKLLAAATLQAEEGERKRISEALHDSVSQLLYGIRIHLNQINTSNLDEGVRKLNKLLETAIVETRNISFELAPPILEHFGLPATIEELTSRLTSADLQFKLRVSGFSQRLELLLENTAFRIIQELVNNCLKHSGATLIEINVRKNKHIEIVVEDNGKGFDITMLKTKPRGTGFSSITSRVNLYNGKIDVKSIVGRGTQVKATLNYE